MIRAMTRPTELLTVEEVVTHLRLDECEDDQWIRDAIRTAREYCEGVLGRPIGEAVYEYIGPCFPEKLNGLLSVESVKYIDTDGVEQDAAYEYIDGLEYLYPDGTWPLVKTGPAAVRVQYRAGYTHHGESPSQSPLPGPVRAAMLLYIGHLYENREASAVGSLNPIPLGIDALLEPYRVRLSMA